MGLYDSECLRISGDSIWGRITQLTSSLAGKRSTVKSRIQFYERLLQPDEQKPKCAEVPIEKLLDSIVSQMKDFGDKRGSEKLSRLFGRLKKSSPESENIIRFIVSMVDLKELEKRCLKEKSAANCYRPCVLRDTKNFDDCMQKLQLPMFRPGYGDGGTIIGLSALSESTEGEDDFHAECAASTSSSSWLSSSYLEPRRKSLQFSHEIDKDRLRNSLFDERGNPRWYSIVPVLCSLRFYPDAHFYMVSWEEILLSLKHLLCGQTSFIFRRNSETGKFYVWNEGCCVIEDDESFLTLSYSAAPFLDFAERLCSVEQLALDAFGLLSSEEAELNFPRVYYVFLAAVQERIFLFRQRMYFFLDEKIKNLLADGRAVLEEALKECRSIALLVKLVLKLKKCKAIEASTIVNWVYRMIATTGNVHEDAVLDCKEVLLTVLNFIHTTLAKWLREGDEGRNNGVFFVNNSVAEGAWKSILENLSLIWRSDFGVELPFNDLLDDEFCKRWLREGKMRKLLTLWPSGEASDSLLDCQKAVEYRSALSEAELRQVLNSTDVRSALQQCLNKEYRKIISLDQYATLRYTISSLNHKTFRLLMDVFLCMSGHLLDSVINVFRTNADFNNLNFVDRSQLEINSIRAGDALMEQVRMYLVSAGYPDNLAIGFKVSYLRKKSFNLRLTYKVAYPLDIVYTDTIMETYYAFWSFFVQLSTEWFGLLELDLEELSFDGQTMLVRSRMLNFIHALREYFLLQIEMSSFLNVQHVMSNNFSIEEAYFMQRNFIGELRRRCFLGRKYSQLMHVLSDCVDTVAEFRGAVAQSDKLAVLSIYSKFYENFELFCHALKLQAKGSDQWLKQLLVLVDFADLYRYLEESEDSSENSEHTCTASQQ